MQLTLQNDEAHALAHELAALTGESVVTAVVTALRERLEREQTERDKQDRLARITALAADIRAHMTDRNGDRDLDRFGERDAARAKAAEVSILWERAPKG